MSSQNDLEDNSTVVVRCGSGPDAKNWDFPLKAIARSGRHNKQYTTRRKNANQVDIALELPLTAGPENIEAYLRFVLEDFSRLSHMPKNKSEETIKQCYSNMAQIYTVALRDNIESCKRTSLFQALKFRRQHFGVFCRL